MANPPGTGRQYALNMFDLGIAKKPLIVDNITVFVSCSAYALAVI
jgi:hypothetical protein